MGGLRGFLAGSLVLVALYVAVQPGSGRAVQEGGGWLISGLRRALSPDVAGVPQVGRGGETTARRLPRREG